MTGEIVLDIEGLEIPVSIVRKHVKNLNLRVRSDGTVTLSIPQYLPLARAREFLERKGTWIAGRIRRSTERAAAQGRGVELPERIPLWGELISRDFVQAGTGLDAPGRGAVGQGVGGSAISGQDAAGQAIPGRTVIDELYRTEVLRALPDVADRMETRVGVHATRWSVRAMKTRWGSCTPKTGAIRINARLAAYPPECLEFVVAHELVHLLEPSHNARFHALLDEFCPENRSLSQRLRQPPFAET